MPHAVFKVGDKTVNRTHMAPALMEISVLRVEGEKKNKLD